MLPVGFPLQYLTGRIEYPITKGDLEPISHNFAYSRGISAKTKFNQALMDEMFKAIILKTRKSYAPPIANNSGRILSKRIFDPGTVHNNIDPAKLQQIGENNGITGPEMTAIEYVKKIIDESSINPLFEGQRTPGEQTAKEIAELQKQSLMRLGVAIIGVINMETDMVWKRMWDIIRNWTEAIDVKVDKVRGETLKKYRTETVESEFEDGQKGQRIIEMKTGGHPNPRQIKAEENLLTRKKGVPVRKLYIDPEKLRSVKYRFYVKVTPSERDQSELRAIMFEESMLKAMQMFPESINKEYVKQQWAIYQKLDPEKLFIQGAPSMMGMPGQQQGQPGMGALGAQGLPQPPRAVKPSMKQLQTA
uniref:Portal protein n=1 Tax=viral metagenome TaxID=1070528 RepID=A0A6M3LKL2_9ZZZZ